jgi:probable phosphoglycerate mutase
MTHLYLIRHADYIYDVVDGQYPKQNQGLSAEGKIQAECLRDRLVKRGEIKPEVFICSAERGARETAEVIAPAFETPFVLDKDFEEWRSEDGTLSTEAFMEPWEKLSDDEKPYHRWIEGCETLLEFSLRVHVALNRVVEEHEGKTILILTHGAFIQVSFAYFFGFSTAVRQRAVPEINRTSITHWYHTGKTNTNRWILKRSNDCHHLE